MLYKFGTAYSEEDFNADEMKALENKIASQVKPEDRIIGTSFIFKGVLFTLNSIIFDLDEDTKIMHIQQMTRLKRIVQPIKGVFTN